MSAEIALGVTISQVTAGAGASAGVTGAGASLGAGLGAAANAAAALLVPAATVIGAGAAAVLITRASVAGTEALARGLVRLHDRLELERDQWMRAEEAADLWREAVSQVMVRNARIGVLRQAAPEGDLPPAGPDGPIPPPLTIAGHNLEDLYRWSRDTDRKLEAARARQAKARTAAARRRLAAAADELPPALARAEQALLDRHERLLEATPAAADQAAAGHQVRATIDRVLKGLDPLVGDDGYARVLEAARRAEAAGSLWEAQPWLRELRVRAEKANDVARGALAASQYLDAIQEGLGSPRDHGDRVILDQLGAVVARQRPLDEPLRAAAERLRAAGQAAAERRYLRTLVEDLLGQFGYDVGEEFDTLTSELSRLVFSKPDWNDHKIEMVIKNGKILAEVVRTEEADGEDAARLDTERQAQWCADLERLGREFLDMGIDTEIDSIVQPGARPAPVVAGARKRPTPPPAEPLRRERRR